MRKYFCFDCETGGINPKMSLLTLYGMVLDQNLHPIDKIDLKIKPDNGRYSISAEAVDINKIDIVQHDKVAIPEREAAKEFYDFAFRHGGTTKMIPTGHNISLDVRFVKQHLLKDEGHYIDGNAWGRFFSYRRLDTATISHFLRLAGRLPSDLDGSLQSLAKYFDLSYEDAHNAEFDAKLTLKVLKLLIGLVGDVSLY